jgi:phosphotriesterase-related protein
MRSMSEPRGGIDRRALFRLLGIAAGATVIRSLGGDPAPAFGQPGGWFAAASRSRPTFVKGSIIRTLAQDIDPEQFPAGAVQFHEHVGGRFVPAPPLTPTDIPPGPVVLRDEAAYLDLMVEELKMSRAEGVSCLVDAAAAGRRDARTVDNLKQISSRSGVHIVLAGGHYQDLAMPVRYPADVANMSEEQLEEEFVRDAGQQGWGAFGEIASSQTMQPEERRVLRAIGKAHSRVNLPIFTHTPHEGCPACAAGQLDLFESVGVDPRRVGIGHLAGIKMEMEPLGQTAKALAKRGAFVGFDTVGHMMGRSMIPESQKVRHVLAVLEAGYEDHVLLSADSTPVPQLKSNWGQGFSSVTTQFVPKLRYAGVDDAVLHKVLVDNPRRFLAFVPKR